MCNVCVYVSNTNRRCGVMHARACVCVCVCVCVRARARALNDVPTHSLCLCAEYTSQACFGESLARENDGLGGWGVDVGGTRPPRR